MCRHFCWCMYTYIRLYLRMCMGIASHPQQPPITPPNPPNSSPQKQHLEAQGPNKDLTTTPTHPISKPTITPQHPTHNLFHYHHPSKQKLQHLEAQGPNKDFWAALALVCKDELAKAGALPGADALTSGGVHAAVAEELEGMYVFLGW